MFKTYISALGASLVLQNVRKQTMSNSAGMVFSMIITKNIRQTVHLVRQSSYLFFLY